MQHLARETRRNGDITVANGQSWRTLSTGTLRVFGHSESLYIVFGEVEAARKLVHAKGIRLAVGTCVVVLRGRAGSGRAVSVANGSK